MTTSTFHRSSSNTPTVLAAWTRRLDGDFHPARTAADELAGRQRRIVDRPWTMLDQHHGTTIVRVEEPGARSGERADGAITDSTEAALAVWVGDCAPLLLVGVEREIAVAHAGWRGLAAGAVDAAIDAFSEPVEFAVLGPTICGACYEFGSDDLDSVARGVGADRGDISSTTREGTLGLDVVRAVESAFARRGIPLVKIGECPGCAPDGGFSHRVRAERERHVLVAWQVDAVGGEGA